MQAARRTITPGRSFTITGCDFGGERGHVRVVGPLLDAAREGNSPWTRGWSATPHLKPEGSTVDATVRQWGDRRVVAELHPWLVGFPDQEVTLVLQTRDGRELRRESVLLQATQATDWLYADDDSTHIQRLPDCPGCAAARLDEPCQRWPGVGDPPPPTEPRFVEQSWLITLPAPWTLEAVGSYAGLNGDARTLSSDAYAISPPMSTPPKGGADRSWRVRRKVVISYVPDRDSKGWYQCADSRLAIHITGPIGLALGKPAETAAAAPLASGRIPPNTIAATAPIAPRSQTGSAWQPAASAPTSRWNLPKQPVAPNSVPTPNH